MSSHEARTEPAPRASGGAEDEEYPASIWPKLYGGVLGFLLFDIVVFGVITWWFR